MTPKQERFVAVGKPRPSHKKPKDFIVCDGCHERMGYHELSDSISCSCGTMLLPLNIRSRGFKIPAAKFEHANH